MSDDAPTPQTTDVPPPHLPQSPQSPAPSHGSGRIRSGAVLWGVALVIVGGLLLVSQFVPGIALWRYWPLVIVAVGVRQMLGPAGGHWSIKHAVDGLVTIAFGLVFLGQMLGFLGWNVWLNILKLWPLLLVSLGLEIAGKGLRSEWVRALGGLVVIGGLAYGSLVMTATGTWSPLLPSMVESVGFSSEAPHQARVTQGAAVVNGGVGEFSLAAGDYLASAEGRSPLEPVFDVEADGRSAIVEIGLEGSTWAPSWGDSRIDVTLDEDVVWDLEIDAGVSTYEVDLSELAVSELVFSAGVSDGTLQLGPADRAGTRDAVPVEIDAGISSLVLRVPEGENVRVRVGDGLSAVDTRGSWTSEDDGDRDVYLSEGFDDTGAYWDIEIDSGVGSITIEYY